MNTNRVDIGNVLAGNDRIIMDTASIMKEDGFRVFVENNHDGILQSGLRLYIPATVYQELVRHLTSDNEIKAKKAMAAINLIRTYNDIFETGRGGFSDAELQRAFADREIYNLLIHNRGRFRQLLITNDVKLGNDAGNINLIESSFGKKVSVCCLTDRGYLYEKNNYGESNAEETEADVISTKQQDEGTEELDEIDRGADQANNKPLSALSHIAVGAGMFITGYMVCRNHKLIKHILTSAI